MSYSLVYSLACSLLYLRDMYSLHSRKSSPIFEVSSPRTCLLGLREHSKLFHFEATEHGGKFSP